MSIDLSLIGKDLPSVEHSWTSTDALLYALGVGGGAEDPSKELAFTTENSHRTPQQVLPTFAVLLSGRGQGKLGDFSLQQVLHGEQGIRLFGSLPPVRSVRTTSRVANVYDKGANALILLEGHCVAATSGQPLADIRSWVIGSREGCF